MNKFLEEILEQPDAIERALHYFTVSTGKQTLENVKDAIKSKEFEQIIFTGMGSSFFVSHAASCLFNELKMYSFAMNASELLHYNLSLFERRTLLVCLSQSGESIEILEILNKLPSKVCCIGITNEETSTLARKSEFALFCRCGKEDMTSTKTYVLTSLVSYILGWNLAGMWDDKKYDKIRMLSARFRSMLTGYDSWLQEALDFLGDIQTVQIIARGPAFSTACQSALMFKEAVRIPAAGILGGEFRHGPMEMVSEGFKSVLFASQGKTFVQSMKMAEDIARFGGKVLLITNGKIKPADKKIMPLFIDEPDEYLFSVMSILPLQLFVDSYAKRGGFEAGSFSRGNKVTRVE